MPEESTTPDLVERTRAIFEAMDRDWDIDALEANWAPDIVWDMSESVLGTLHGRAAVREFLESWWATWEDHHHHIEEIRDYGYGVVFIALLEDGRPVGSEGRVQAQNVMVHEWVDGKTVRITSYADIDKARAAAERLAEERG
jgi:ketosteroid isomerase-like protein